MTEHLTVAQEHPVEVWSALAGVVTLLVGLIGYLFRRINSDLDDCDERLDNGVKEFEVVHQDIIKLQMKIEVLNHEQEWLLAEYRKLHDDFIALKTEHNECRDIVRKIGK